MNQKGAHIVQAHWLQGRKAVFLGDSITEGVGVSDPQNIYCERVKRELGLRAAINCGIGGTRIAAQPDDGGLSFSDRCRTLDADADLVVVFGGTNDYGHGTAPIGSRNDHTPETYCGALHVLFQSLTEKYPDGVVVLTPLHRTEETVKNTATGYTLKEYVELLKEIAAEYSIPVLDLYAQGGIVPSVPANRERFCPDGLHPNDVGHALIARKLCAFLKCI